MVGMAHCRHDAEGGAAEGRVQLCDQFLERIFLGAERTAEIPAEPRGMTGGVPRFVQRRAVPINRLEIGGRRRHPHIVLCGS